MKRKHIRMTKKHKHHLANTAKKTRKANIFKTMHRGGYRA